ncbi:class I SAM-dependent methyltransferase [Bradyrhizobium sp. 83002]|uniref:class I SAM-dependent DNA methyltransferase n=1 Tax=Bradyrhizobium aeschynomenes TaxID=2734909 RepID=UPI001556E9F3|nr:class I SAM-dependent methyltransferase [Bradyrhizobium aeschynomenes]NPU12535.1 class I SAM-dependent methyltransferase [Bradyrhizobium aeschynomenes]
MTEAAHRIVAHYETHALSWDADRRAAAWTDRPAIDRFVALLRPGATVLDFGCGGGVPVAAHIVAQGFSVTGVDSSPTMISLCRTRMPGQAWIVADMRSFTSDRRFDGVLAWDSFFHLAHDDQRRMFPIFAACTAPDGVLMFNAGPAHGEAMGSYRGDPLYHASLDPSEYEALLLDGGFALITHETGDPSTGGRSFWLARRLAPAHGGDQRRSDAQAQW